MDAETRARVKALVGDFVDRWLNDNFPAGELVMIEEEGASPSGLLAPFHDALVPGITSMKERSFSTRLGNLHERVAESRPGRGDEGTVDDGGRNETERRDLGLVGDSVQPVRKCPFAHAFAQGFFDFDREVMVGAQFWSFVGQSDETYEELLDVYREVGESTRDRISAIRQRLVDATHQTSDG